MGAYSEAYLGDVVENQGKLFDFVAQSYPDSDTEDFINTYMKSKTRKNIDDAMAYVCLLYTSPSPRDRQKSRMPSSA